MRILTSCVLSFLMLGCGPHKKSESNENPVHLSEAKAFSVKVDWKEGPFSENYSIAVITFLNAKNETPSSVELLEVKPWMKIHGHGTKRKVPVFKALDATSFEVTNIYFTMPGPWELNIKAKVDGREDTIEYTFEVPES